MVRIFRTETKFPVIEHLAHLGHSRCSLQSAALKNSRAAGLVQGLDDSAGTVKKLE